MSLSMRCGADPGLVLTVDSGHEKKSVTATGLPLKPDAFTHVAITWGEQIELFVAGRRRGSLDMKLPAALAASSDKFGLRFGCAGDLYGNTGIVLDELRVSNVVRYRGDAVETPKAPFTADPQTLLLDHLDENFRPDGENAETRAEVCSGGCGELGGTPSIGCRVVKGRFGSAMQIANGERLAPAEMVRHYGVNAVAVLVVGRGSGIDDRLAAAAAEGAARWRTSARRSSCTMRPAPGPVLTWAIRPWAHRRR